MQKYRNRKSIRLKRYDYSSPGYYFITICVKNRERVLGKIKNGKIILSQIGKIANECWRLIPFHFKNVVLDDFIIMPDHIHGILIIENADMISAGARFIAPIASQIKFGAPRNTGAINRARTLGEMIRYFKGKSSFMIHKIDGNFAWHRNYHDRIIRDEKAYRNIQQYILNNPMKWELKMRMR